MIVILTLSDAEGEEPPYFASVVNDARGIDERPQRKTHKTQCTQITPNPEGTI